MRLFRLMADSQEQLISSPYPDLLLEMAVIRMATLAPVLDADELLRAIPERGPAARRRRRPPPPPRHPRRFRRAARRVSPPPKPATQAHVASRSVARSKRKPGPGLHRLRRRNPHRSRQISIRVMSRTFLTCANLSAGAALPWLALWSRALD